MGKIIAFPKETELKPGLAKQMLDKVKKEELIDICMDFNIDHKKTLSKKELCERIEKAILEDPWILGERLPLDDLRILNKIVEAGGSLVTDEFLFTLPIFGRGLMSSEILNDEEGQICFSIPDNLYLALKPVIKDMLENERLLELERREMLICGMAQLYGAISVKDLHKLLTESYDIVMDYEELLSFLMGRDRLAIDLQPFLIKKEFGIASIMMDDPETFYAFIQKRKDLGYYPFDEGELLMHGEQEFFPVFDEADELLEFFLLENDELDENMEKVIKVWELIQNETPLNKVLSHFTDDNPGDINELMRLLIEFHNNVPRWSLKGHTPSDLQIIKNKNVDPLSKTTNPFFPFNQGFPSEPICPKVGRNDPCPCGNGKKYKKCCGMEN